MKRTFSCCGKIAHQDCWKRQFMLKDMPAPLGAAKCRDVWTYLKKDRFTEDPTASEFKKQQSDPSENLSCDLCHTSLSRSNAASEGQTLNVKEHYLRNCPAVPGPILKRQLNRRELFDRIASLSLIKKIRNPIDDTGDTNDRVFNFGRSVEERCSSSRDGFQRSLEEPPD